MAPRKNSRPARRPVRRPRRSTIRVGRLARGLHYSPSADPPNYTSIPWNQAVVIANVKVAAGERTNVIVTTIQQCIQEQLGLYYTNISKDPVPLEFRIDDLRFYNIDSQALTVQIHDWQKLSADATKVETAAVLTDLPAKNRYARVGYKPAIADISVPFHDGGNILYSLLSPSNSMVVVYHRILWRTYHSVPTESVTATFPETVSTFSALPSTSSSSEQTELIKQLIKVLDGHLVMSD